MQFLPPQKTTITTPSLKIPTFADTMPHLPENLQQLSIKDYTYQLPDNRIAPFPLPERDASKLLLYNGGKIGHTSFKNISEHLPENSLLVFNDTRVVHARLLFQNPNGQTIEIFCLEPVAPVAEIQQAMQQAQTCVWKCLIGNARKWKAGELKKDLVIDQKPVELSAEKLEFKSDYFLVEFSWNPAEIPFANVLDAAGVLPLPPYFKRTPNEADEHRYQTVYARHEGSVAAPTAGLHFTPNVIKSLQQKNIDCRYITLHVGAGTFRPVKADTMLGHEMHTEEISISLETLQAITDKTEGAIIAVGTTSLRTLESLYWFGLKLLQGSKNTTLQVNQWQPYEQKELATASAKESLETIIKMLQETNQSALTGRTGILIGPGYEFRICKGLVTNFHQPESTLLLLVSAFIGDDWRTVYDYALANDFRFLSYGDSSLLWRYP